MIPLVNIMLSETVFGGVGAGLYGILIYVVLSVFIAGLMVGRTPEYLGKKIEAYDVKMAMLVTLVFPLIILVLTGISSVEGFGTSSISNAGPHGLTQILYAFTSMAGNNGSAFAGLERQHALVQHRGRDHDAGGTVLHDHSHARDCWQSGKEEDGAGFRGYVSGNDAPVCHSAGVGDCDRRSADIFPRA